MTGRICISHFKYGAAVTKLITNKSQDNATKFGFYPYQPICVFLVGKSGRGNEIEGRDTVCVCVRAREREGEGGGERERDRHRQIHRD